MTPLVEQRTHRRSSHHDELLTQGDIVSKVILFGAALLSLVLLAVTAAYPQPAANQNAPTSAGEEESPLGPLVANARAQGYARHHGAPTTYHGYYYRVLTAQGPDAHGGSADYIVNGQMTGGFGLVAFPARYGASGVMTFVVNQDGIVYQKDLGPKTAHIAAAMQRFNPDRSWTIAKTDD